MTSPKEESLTTRIRAGAPRRGGCASEDGAFVKVVFHGPAGITEDDLSDGFLALFIAGANDYFAERETELIAIDSCIAFEGCAIHPLVRIGVKVSIGGIPVLLRQGLEVFRHDVASVRRRGCGHLTARGRCAAKNHDQQESYHRGPAERA